jgi:hypothetical protein
MEVIVMPRKVNRSDLTSREEALYVLRGIVQFALLAAQLFVHRARGMRAHARYPAGEAVEAERYPGGM